MYELPLFPLNSVLFPGMPLPLRIFEERYKLMINLCIEKREPFGVVLIANNVADISSQAEPYMVGTTAQITQVQPLGGGQMNITAVGKDRFKIVSLQHDRPYLVGQVEPYPMEDENAPHVAASALKLRQQIERYLEILKQAGQVQVDVTQLPNDAASLTYLAAVVLQNLSSAERQSILEIERMIDMIRELRLMYSKEVALMDKMLNPPENNDYRGIFSLS